MSLARRSWIALRIVAATLAALWRMARYLVETRADPRTAEPPTEPDAGVVVGVEP